MSFENKFKKFFFYIFSKKRFNLLFLLLILGLLSFILFNNNNLLIEGNKNKENIIKHNINKLNKNIRKGRKKQNVESSTMEQNKKGNKIINESFVENMDCSKSNYFNYDKKNTSSSMIGKVCNSSKQIGQEHGVIN